MSHLLLPDTIPNIFTHLKSGLAYTSTTLTANTGMIAVNFNDTSIIDSC